MTEAAGDGDHPVFLAVNLECAADFRRYRKRVTPQSHLLDEGAGSVGSGFAPDNPVQVMTQNITRERPPPDEDEGRSRRSSRRVTT
jgi:hypothetical protein